MSVPRRHHHNPVFQLRRWADPVDGKVCVFQRIGSKIAMKRWAPKATGYEQDLYAIPSRPDEASRQEIEARYLKQIDDDGARALALLESDGSKHIETSTRDAWITFVLSLLYRNPRGVAHLRQVVEQTEPSKFSEFEEEYRARRGPDDPPDLASFFRDADQSFRDEAWASLFIRLMRSQKIGTQLARMHWAIVLSSEELVIGDDPVLHSNGIDRDDGLVALPVGPHLYFVAANSKDTIDYLGGEAAAGRLATAFNRAQATQAVRRLFAGSDIHEQMLRDYLGLKQRSDLRRLTWSIP